MNTTNFDPNCAPNVTNHSGLLRTIFVEPLLVVATGTFWLLALPLVGLSLGCVKVWDGFVALNSNETAVANPLILRKHRQLDDAPALTSATEIWAISHI